MTRKVADEQASLDLGDPVLDANGSRARAKLLRELRETLLPNLGKWSEIHIKGDEMADMLRFQSQTFGDHWPTFLLEQPGRKFAIVPVSRAPKNDKPGSDWGIALMAFRQHQAYEAATGVPVVYVFGDHSVVLLKELDTSPTGNCRIADLGHGDQVVLGAAIPFPLGYVLGTQSRV